MGTLKHRKKRNLGLVYEFLTREVTDAVVARDKARASRAMKIMAEHLSEGTVLYPELSLHRQVMESRGIGERLARRIVDELKTAGIMGERQRTLIESAKSDLIHDMNRVLGRDIFDRYRIPNYTAHASINILMTRGVNGRLDEGVEVARVEDHLIEFLCSPSSGGPRYDRDATLYAYKTAVGLFEQEFGKELTDGQAELLREYVRVSLGGNTAPFIRTFERQRNLLREELRVRRSDEVFKSDAEMGSRLDEAISDLSNLAARADDEAVERLMLFHNLKREIES